MGFLRFISLFAFALGALAQEPASVSYSAGLRPVLDKLGCSTSACHGAARGKGGLKLSLFGADPQWDWEALARAEGGRRINCAAPEKSLLLLKTTGGLPHAGGAAVKPDSTQYRALLAWIRDGAVYSNENEPQLTGLKVASMETVLKSGETGQIQVTGLFSNRTERDVTAEAILRSSDPKVAIIFGEGRIKAGSPGESVVLVSCLRKAVAIRVLVPQALTEPFPKLEANNKIDELVYARLKRLGLPPSPLCSDQEFLRRVYLDVIGILPTPNEARAFLADADPQKRPKLIDRLLVRDEYADFWTLKWGDLLRIKSEYPVRLWPKAVQVYYRWVRESIASNKPYDQFARELLDANGSDFRDGPANFMRAVPNKDPQTIAENTALVLMGTRIGCAHCHGHPTEDWSVRDDLGMAAFFAKVAYKPTLEWKEEIVFLNPKGVLRNPVTKEVVKPKFLDGPVVEIDKDEDPRPKFAAWLTAPGNPWFSRNIANRVWFWLLGRGIVHEPDDLRPTNPPVNPELLDYLAADLADHKYDLRQLYRLILNSRTYQLSSVPNASNAADDSHFSHHLDRRLGAEQLSDAVCQVTETAEKFQSTTPEPYTFLPPGHRAEQIADGNIATPFLELFGKPSRDTPYESERNSQGSLWQTLYFINSDQLEGKITGSPRLKRLLAANKSDAEIVEEIYLAALSRLPTGDENREISDYLGKNKAGRPQAFGDLMWAVLNTKEFLRNR